VPAASDYNAPQLRDVIKAGAWDYQFSLIRCRPMLLCLFFWFLSFHSQSDPPLQLGLCDKQFHSSRGSQQTIITRGVISPVTATVTHITRVHVQEQSNIAQVDRSINLSFWPAPKGLRLMHDSVDRCVDRFIQPLSRTTWLRLRLVAGNDNLKTTGGIILRRKHTWKNVKLWIAQIPCTGCWQAVSCDGSIL